MRKNQMIGLFVSMIGFTALVAWWQIPFPKIDSTNPIEEEPWTLPTSPPAADTAAFLDTLRQLSPWKQDATNQASTIRTLSSSSDSPHHSAASQAEEMTPSKTPWKFVGVVRQGDKRYILVLDESTSKVTQYALNRPLPDGTSLLAIHNDFIEVMKEGKREVIRLYD